MVKTMSRVEYLTRVILLIGFIVSFPFIVYLVFELIPKWRKKRNKK